MSGLDFAPAPAPAPATARVITHARTEFTLLVRNGEQLLLALVIPVGILIIGKIVGGSFGDLNVLVPSVLALAVWSSSFTSVAIATGFERRYGVLERLVATPLGRSGLLAGKAISIAWVVLGQLMIVSAAGVALGWRPDPGPLAIIVAVFLVILSAACFCCLALALAGRLRAEATLALANVIYVVLLAGGGLVLPLSRYPERAAHIVQWLPTAALGEGLRDALAGQLIWWPVGVAALWLIIAAAAAWKGFRWIS